MRSIKGKYLVEVFDKSGCYFLKLLYRLGNEKIENIEFEDILENNNCLRVVFGDYIPTMTSYKKNKDLVENNKLLVATLPELEDHNFFMLAKGYNEYDSNSSKYATYINNLKIDKINNERIYQVIDGNTLIYDFNNFKHNKEYRVLPCDNPICDNIYIKFGNYLYGYLSWKENKSGIEIICTNISYKVDKIKINEINDKRIFINDYNNIEDYELLTLNNDYSKKDEEDFIEYSVLISQFVNSFSNKQIKNFSLNKKQLKETLSNVPKLSEYRKKLVEGMINEQNFFVDTIDMVIDNIYEDEERLDKICKEMAQRHSEIIEDKLEMYSKDVNNKKEELKIINNQINDAKEELNKINKDREKQLEIQNKDKLEKLKNEMDKILKDKNEMEDRINDLQDEIDSKIKELALINDIGFLENYKKCQEMTKKNELEEIEKIKSDKRKILEECKEISDRSSKAYKNILDEASEKIKEEYKKSQFENYSINKMIAITSAYNHWENLEEIKMSINNRNYLHMDVNSKEELINNIRNFIVNNARRNISYDDVVNIMICISQGFLTIFAGEPGTGKTSLCNILAKSMGLCKAENNSRFLQVSVEKGWTSKSDFIGYFNPLTKRFDSSNRKVYDAFKLLDLEYNIREDVNHEIDEEFIEYPYLMLLDEANLSPMEHYWADFMNACDIYEEDRYISLSENDYLKIAPYFRFLATINYDHTTEVLSPRLIDRAWILLLDGEEIDINSLSNSNAKNNSKIITYDDMKKFMNLDNKNMPSNIVNRLHNIVLRFRSKGINISPRVLKMIKDYCAVGNKLFKNNNDLVALDYAVSQKILPMLDGFGSDYKSFLEDIKENELSGMKKCQSIIDNIISKGDKNMKHYQFFGI